MSKLLYPTPHINSDPQSISKTVLMPGDPKRAELVAKQFLSEAYLFNDVRGVSGYTGKWEGDGLEKNMILFATETAVNETDIS